MAPPAPTMTPRLPPPPPMLIEGGPGQLERGLAVGVLILAAVPLIVLFLAALVVLSAS